MKLAVRWWKSPEPTSVSAGLDEAGRLAQKLSKLIKGAAVGAAASFFVIGALIMLLNGTAWFIYWTNLWWDDDQIFWGFFLTAAIFLVLAALAGWIAARAFKAGSPPVPEMAIEEAQRIKETIAQSEPGSGS